MRSLVGNVLAWIHTTQSLGRLKGGDGGTQLGPWYTYNPVVAELLRSSISIVKLASLGT